MNPQGLPERTISELRLYEFGPVLFPAYQGATAAVRSMTDEFLFAALIEDPERLRELLRTARIDLAEILQAPEPDAPERTTPETDEPGIEPEPSGATTHSDRGLFWFTDTPKHLKRC